MELCDVVLVAAGQGLRLGQDLPKQFQIVKGRPLYLWSLEVFLNWDRLGEMTVVVPQDWVKPVQESLEILKNHKKVHVVAGGSLRQESTLNGLEALTENNQGWVMIHDAARPNIDAKLLNLIWEARQAGSGVVPGVVIPDTVKKVRASEASQYPVVETTVSREGLMLIQTPQLFEKDILLSAYGQLNEGDVVSDEAGLYERIGRNVIVVPGTHDNLKVTFAEDLERVSSWLRS